jgi:hypothetical protein
MGMTAFRRIGAEVIKGNYDVFSDIAAARVVKLADKALGAMDVNFMQRAIVKRKQKTVDLVEPVKEVMGRKGKYLDAERFSEKAQQLTEEANRLIANMQEKQNRNGLRTEQEIKTELQVFYAYCDSALGHIRGQYGISERDFRKLVKREAEHKYPPSVPFRGYDSLGTPGRIRTIREPLRPTKGFYD